MVRKIYEIGEKENPRKKYRGIFENIFPFGYGSLRKVLIRHEDGTKTFFTAHFKTLEREEKGINLGDRIEIDYKDDKNFTMKKLTGK